MHDQDELSTHHHGFKLKDYQSSPVKTWGEADNNHHGLPGFTNITQHKDCDKGYNTSTYIS